VKCLWTACGLNKDDRCTLPTREEYEECKENMERWGRGWAFR